MKASTHVEFTSEQMILTIINIQFKGLKDKLIQKLSTQQADMVVWRSMDEKQEYSWTYDEQNDSIQFKSLPASITQINSFPAFIDIFKDRIYFQNVLFGAIFSEGMTSHNCIHQIEISPVHILLKLKMPNFVDSFTQPYQFELSRFKNNEFSDADDKNLKLALMELPTQLLNYLKPYPLNYGLMCCSQNLENLVNLLYNCYLPLQVLQNVLSERVQPNCNLRLDKSIWVIFRQILSFLPTTQFGIISFNYKPDTSAFIYGHLNRISHSCLCLNLESQVEGGCIEITVKLNEQYQQFMSCANQQITHTELCQLLNVPTYLEQFRSFMGQLFQPSSVHTGETTKFRLNNGEAMEKFFTFFLLYLFITLIKYTYLSLCHQQYNESKLTHKTFDKFYKFHNSHSIDILRKPFARIYHFYTENCAKSNLLFYFTHNQLCICYFIIEANKKMVEIKKRLPNEEKSKIEMQNLSRLQDKLITQEYHNGKGWIQGQLHPTLTKIDETEIKITFPSSNVTLFFHGTGNDIRMSKTQGEDKNYTLDQLTDQDLNYIRDCVYNVGTQQKH